MYPRTPSSTAGFIGATAGFIGAVVLCAQVPGAWAAERGGSSQAPDPIAMEADGAWCLRPLSERLVAFRGLEAADANSLGTGTMLYPAPSAAGFLAAVATHAAIVGGVRAKHAREQADAANKVLEPYQAVLGSFTSQELEDRTLDARAPEGARKLACSATRTASWIIDSAPVYFMTQDQTALVLDNVVTIHPSGTPGTTVRRYTVRMVSRPLGADAPAATWLADNGAKLKADGVALLGQSLDIVLHVAAGDPVPPDAPFKSFHYYEGTADKVERAQLASETCERLLLKTLRATFLSVPTMRVDCAPDSGIEPSGSVPH